MNYFVAPFDGPAASRAESEDLTVELSTEVLMDMHRRMVRIRLFEEGAGPQAEATEVRK